MSKVLSLVFILCLAATGCTGLGYHPPPGVDAEPVRGGPAGGGGGGGAM